MVESIDGVIEQLETWATPPAYAGDPCSFVMIEREKCARMAKVLRDLVNQQFDVDWPCYEDGTPVQFGDEVVGSIGETFNVGIVSFISGGTCLMSDYADGYTITSIAIIHPGYFAEHPKPNDTWEKLEADSELKGCDYWRITDGSVGCYNCEHVNDTWCDVRRDIVRRAKALAGVE